MHHQHSRGACELSPRCVVLLTSWRQTTLAWQCRARRPGATWRSWHRRGQEGLQRRGWWVVTARACFCVAHTQGRKPAWHAPSRPSAAPGKELLLVPVHVDWWLRWWGPCVLPQQERAFCGVADLCGPGMGQQRQQEQTGLEVDWKYQHTVFTTRNTTRTPEGQNLLWCPTAPANSCIVPHLRSVFTLCCLHTEQLESERPTIWSGHLLLAAAR